jgi:drug/metabolite transporter (DMT)-like permease
MTTGSVLLLTLAALAAAGGQLLFKVGAHGRDQFTDFINVHIFLGLCLYVIGTAIWIYALSFERLVNVFAFTALTFVLVYAGGVFLLGERLTVAAMSGVMLVLLGLYLIATNST